MHPPRQPHSQSHPQPPGNIPLDPALSLYSPYYGQYQQSSHQQHSATQQQQHLVLQNYSSPSSQGSDTLGTPPTEHAFPGQNHNGKRPSSALSGLGGERKKLRKDVDAESEANSPTMDKEEVKAKPTRGSRACTVCRRLKMKCVGAEQGPPCKRCIAGNHECIFEESNRGKRSSKKHEVLTRSLRNLEKTLDTVLRSIGNPSIASGMISRSPSPSAQTQSTSTQALLAQSPSPQPSSSTSLPQSASVSGGYASRPPPGSPKLHSLPDNSLNPLGLLAEASLANRRAQVSKASLVSKIAAAGDGQTLGVASDNYFKPGPMTILPLRRLYIERQVQPEMLSFVSTDEVVALFDIYFDHISMHCSLLDRNFHTPSLVCSRSPFLLTTICSIASKFYTANPDLHPRLTELAKKLAFSVPAKGYKSVEIVQAYLLLSLWGCGAVERYEQDKTWLLLGMAIRMATDLNLHRKTAVTSPDTAEGKARDTEVHNRERTWILCFCLDRSFSAQMGKPHSIKEDYIIRHAIQWSRAPVALPSDASICAYAELQRILSRSLDFLYSGTDSASGLQTHCDYMLVIKSFESQLGAWRERWYTNTTWQGEKPNTADYKALISTFYFHYANLVLNSFGLQNALERAPMDIGHFFGRVHSNAMACALIVRDQLGPSGYMKYSPDSHFVQTSYAVLSLLKLVRPEFQAFLENEQKTLSLVRDVADVLEKLAASTSHTPALYAAFLRALISAKLDPQQGMAGEVAKQDEGDSVTDACPGQPSGIFENLATDAASSLDIQQPTSISDTAPNPETTTMVSANSPDVGSPSANVNMNNFSGMNQTSQQSQQLQPQTTAGTTYYHDPQNYYMNEFHFESEMGPATDISTFPPTMAPHSMDDQPTMSGLAMENILSSGFWDNMLVPGYNSMDGLSGGFVFGAGGSGLITPRFGVSPIPSGTNTPSRSLMAHSLTQSTINAAFNSHGQQQDGIKIDS